MKSEILPAEARMKFIITINYYLETEGYEINLLLNFGKKLKFKRFVYNKKIAGVK